MPAIFGLELGVIKKQNVHYACSENSRILNLTEKKSLCCFHLKRLHEPIIYTMYGGLTCGLEEEWAFPGE
jgi:hypothetical protein